MMDWKKIDLKNLNFQYPILLVTKEREVSFFNDERELKWELMLQKAGMAVPREYTHWMHITLPV